VVSIYEYLSDPVAYVNNVDTTTHGDGFFSTEYLQRDLQGLKSVQFSINNKSLNYSPLNKYEAFNNNLLCLGYENIDASRNGLIDSCVSILHYYKYYSCVFQSLSLIDKDQYYISGLSSAGSSCAVNCTMTFDGSASYKVTPVIIAKLSEFKRLNKKQYNSVTNMLNNLQNFNATSKSLTQFEHHDTHKHMFKVNDSHKRYLLVNNRNTDIQDKIDKMRKKGPFYERYPQHSSFLTPSKGR
jgi:hypothetical protein